MDLLIDSLPIFRMIALAGMCCWAAYSDLYEKRIPNALTVTGLLLGTVLGFAVEGPPGIMRSMLGILAGGGPFMLLYLIGVGLRKPLMGAGDVKLAAAIGAFTGFVGALYTLYYGLITAGIAGLCIMLYCAIRMKKRPKTIALGACLGIGAIFWMAISGPGLGRITQ